MDVWALMREHPAVIGKVFGRPTTGLFAWSLVGVGAALYPFTAFLGTTQGDRVPPLLQFGSWGALGPLTAIEFGIVGALILRRRPGHAVGWLAIVGGFCLSLSIFAGAYAAYSITHGDVLPAVGLAYWLRGWVWLPAFTFLFALIPAVFPDGSLPSPRWRPIVWAVAVGVTAQLAWVSVGQLVFGIPPLIDRPWPKSAWLFELLTTLSGVLPVLAIFAAVGALALRFRRSVGTERQQLKWFLAAVGLQAVLWAGALAVASVNHQAPYQVRYFDVLIPMALLTLPLAIGVAILRHRLYDIDVVISRGLVYAGLGILITVAYLSVVVAIGLALGTGGRPNLPLSVIAMAVVVVLVQPVRSRLQRLANRLVYGAPTDPYAVLGQLSRTPAAGDIDHALAQIAQAVARGMASPRAQVRLLLPEGQSRMAT
jgi:hypothetical protein